ncbi:MAG: BamA/TamA family outer membrane protein [Candidatus Delongbacteria bacterium]|nr:BamA/TamA family outer membrane protein [Candidatus Delongbacteria bacterium]MBN2835429.1 BamA/TamA family outer membrane protein [Candidatus Delongbacteria bacterium]
MKKVFVILFFLNSLYCVDFNGKSDDEKIEYLKNTGVYLEIDKDINSLANLYKAPVINAINLFGNQPILEEQILKQLQFNTGLSFDSSKVSEVESQLTNYLKNEGLINVHVEIISRYKGEFVDLDIKILKDGILKIDKLDLSGNSSYSTLRLKFQTETFYKSLYFGQMSRFSEVSLKNDVKNLQKFYKDNGFYDSKVSYVLKRNGDLVTPIITIVEGLEYTVEYEGNDEFYDFTLNNITEKILYSTPYNIAVKRIEKELLHKYNLYGYNGATINIESEDIENRKIVHIQIDEGVVDVLDKTEIIGLDDKELLQAGDYIGSSVSGTFSSGIYSTDQVVVDSSSISGFLNYLGYTDHILEVKRIKTDLNRYSLKFNITKNERALIDEIVFKGIGIDEVENLKSKILLGDNEPFMDFKARSDALTISSYFSELGYPYANVLYTFENGVLTYDLKKGVLSKNGDIFISGNFKTDSSYVVNMLKFEKDSLFSLKNMFKGQKSLRNSGLFNNTRFKTPGLIGNYDTIDLYVELSEKNPYYIDFGGFYDSETGVKLDFAFGDKNFLGKNKTLEFVGSYSNYFESYNLNYEDRNIWSSDYSGLLSLFYENDQPVNSNDRYEDYGISMGIFLKTGELTYGIANRFSRKVSNTYSGTENYIYRVSPYIMYDSRDDILRPKYGVFSKLSTDYSYNFNYDYDKFFKIESDNRFFYKLWFNTFGLAMRNGVIFSDFKDYISGNELFMLGGTSTIRGYEENMFSFIGDEAVGETVFSNLNFEIRTELPFNFEIINFVDSGFLDDNFSFDYRSSVGSGLGYITPIGTISVFYGYKLDKKDGEDQDKWHFSIGYTF